MTQMEELKENYWRAVAGTRKSRRISPSVKAKTEERWKAFDGDVVEEALSIHISRYRDYRETYTIGIMKNLQKKKDSGRKTGDGNTFNRFEQRDYDYGELEKQLLAH